MSSHKSDWLHKTQVEGYPVEKKKKESWSQHTISAKFLVSVASNLNYFLAVENSESYTTKQDKV